MVNTLAKTSPPPPASNKNMPIFSCFFLPTPVQIFMASFKWRKAPEIFHHFAWNSAKKLKLTIEKENRGKIHQKREKYPWITGTLKVCHYFTPTKFLPCFFPSWISPPPPGRRFWPKYLPLLPYFKMSFYKTTPTFLIFIVRTFPVFHNFFP